MAVRIAALGPSFADYRFTPPQRESLERAAAAHGTLVVFDSQRAFRAAAPEFDIAAGQFGLDPLPSFGRLRWFHSWSAGMDHEPVAACANAGLLITCSKGNGAVPIAEYAILMMLMLARNAVAWVEAQASHKWRRHLSTELAGKCVGLIGFGNIGRAIATRAQGLGMDCIALRRTPGAPVVDGVAILDTLDTLLEMADFVVVTAPLTEQTKGMLGAREFGLMRPHACYINVSRGAIADPDALAAALRERRLGGAALDAHAVEPLPPDCPFWDLPNTIVTPHNAGTTIATADRALAIFADNLTRFATDRELVNVVEARRGY